MWATGGCDTTARLVLVMLTGWAGLGEIAGRCFSIPFLVLVPFLPPSLSLSMLVRVPPPAFTLRSCGLLSDEFATSPGVDDTWVIIVSDVDIDGLLVKLAALTTGLVTEVLMDGPRTGVDGRTTSPVLGVAVVVAGATGAFGGPITGLGPTFMSSSSAGSNFRFFGNLQTS